MTPLTSDQLVVEWVFNKDILTGGVWLIQRSISWGMELEGDDRDIVSLCYPNILLDRQR
jgi:hypothetical protein